MSTCFAVVNGVKQGGVLSPVLFCVYFDGLLYKLMKAGHYGCYRPMGYTFVGVLAYADDVVLLAPSANAMRKMLRLCDDFASDFDVKFNANKLKCIVFKPYCSHLLTTNLGFQIGGNETEIVDMWLHLGHIITNRCDDDAAVI